jgi:hypothetical protein
LAALLSAGGPPVRRGSVGFFGDDLGAEGFAEEVGVAAGVLFQDDVILADGFGFFLWSEGGFVDGDDSCASGLFGGDGCFCGAALAGGLFAAVRRGIGCCRGSRGSAGLLVGLERSPHSAFVGRVAIRSWSILYCDCRARGVTR